MKYTTFYITLVLFGIRYWLSIVNVVTLIALPIASTQSIEFGYTNYERLNQLILICGFSQPLPEELWDTSNLNKKLRIPLEIDQIGCCVLEEILAYILNPLHELNLEKC
jgi:hypothetical protein